MECLETTRIEGFNGILRERLVRLVRKTKFYAKKISEHSTAPWKYSNSTGTLLNH